jgi:hypothetical protein
MWACSPRRFHVRSIHRRLPHHPPSSTTTHPFRPRRDTRPVSRVAPAGGPLTECLDLVVRRESTPARWGRACAGSVWRWPNAGAKRCSEWPLHGTPAGKTAWVRSDALQTTPLQLAESTGDVGKYRGRARRINLRHTRSRHGKVELQVVDVDVVVGIVVRLVNQPGDRDRAPHGDHRIRTGGRMACLWDLLRSG